MMIFRLPFQQEIFTVNADETDASAVSFFSFDQKRSVHFPGKMVPLQNTESVNTFFPLKAFDHSAFAENSLRPLFMRSWTTETAGQELSRNFSGNTAKKAVSSAP